VRDYETLLTPGSPVEDLRKISKLLGLSYQNDKKSEIKSNIMIFLNKSGIAEPIRIRNCKVKKEDTTTNYQPSNTNTTTDYQPSNTTNYQPANTNTTANYQPSNTTADYQSTVTSYQPSYITRTNNSISNRYTSRPRFSIPRISRYRNDSNKYYNLSYNKSYSPSNNTDEEYKKIQLRQKLASLTTQIQNRLKGTTTTNTKNVTGPTNTKNVTGPTNTKNVTGPTNTKNVTGPTNTKNVTNTNNSSKRQLSNLTNSIKKAVGEENTS
jgi:hypothetical protein